MKTNHFIKYMFVILLIFSEKSGMSIQNNPFFNVVDYGAVGDNKILNTNYIQSAINACAKAGGGTVFFPSGTYLSGSLEVLSNITLHLDAGATIKGSPNVSDYKNMGRTSEQRNTSLIYGINVSNVAITGHGSIDGNDNAFVDWDVIHPECCYDPEYTRQGKNYQNAFPDGPAAIKNHGMRPGILMTFIESNNILMRDVTIKNAPNWCVHLACCDRVEITGVDFLNSLLVPNADAIDISNSKNVNISDCILIAGDDGIAISPCADGFCTTETENIHVSNCTITSRSSGIRIGWAAKNIHNCTFQNLVIYSNRGIGIFSKGIEVIEDLLFDNIIINTRLHTGWWGSGEPIHVSEIPLGTWYGVEQDIKNHGVIRNIRFSNINIISESCLLIYGYNSNSIQNIDFINIRHYFKSSPYGLTRGGNFELRPAFDNKYSVFKHDIPAFYAKNVSGLTISKYDLTCDNDLPAFCTSAIFFEDFSNIKIDGFSGTKLNPGNDYAAIQLKNGTNATVKDCTAKPGTNVFLEIENIKDCSFFMNNDLREARTAISPSNAVNLFKCINNLEAK
jgi:hypothetical protein